MLSRSSWLFVLVVAALCAAGSAHAICDVIPQPEILYRGETGSLSRVYASPGDPLRISIDTAGCESGSAGFSAGALGGASSDFNDLTLQGWTPSGSHLVFNVQDLGIGPTLFGDLFIPQGQGTLAPAAFLGDWAARGVTQLSWVWYGFSSVNVSGSTDLVRISGPGGSAAWRPNEGFIPALQGDLFSAAIDTSAPTGDWVLTSGTWAGLMGQVDELFIGGDLGFLSFEFGYSYVIDDVVLTANDTTGSVATLLYEPPAGPANAVVIPGGGSCAALAAELTTCQAALGGGTAVCRDDLSPTVVADSFRFPMPDQGFAGPVTLAVSPQGAALPCGLATTECGGPGAPSGLLACIDTLFASDGTCESEAVNAHEQFAGLTALPAPNDFSGICDSSNPSIPCSNNNADVRFTTDAEGNLVVPIDWRGVLVPGTLPIPRLVNASTSVAAFVGPPPEPTQTPGAPIEVPGAGFLQSFSPKGLRVDPLFNPLFNAGASTETELFGSADAEFGVVRVLRRSPAFRECEAGDRAGLACIADLECPASQCFPAQCRGGSNDGGSCTGDAQCPDGVCGVGLFDFSDRYSNGGTGPILLASAEYDAEAENPAAIDGLVATDDVFTLVRSESLEGQDLNDDGDLLDDSIVTLRDATTGEAQAIGGQPASVGIATLRARQAPFSFPTLAVEDDIVAFLQSESNELGNSFGTGGGDANTDGDEVDAILRVYRLESGGPVQVAGAPIAAEPLPVIDERSVAIADGLVFFRWSETADTPKLTTPVPTTDASPPNGDIVEASASRSGRFIGFTSDATNLVPGDTNGARDVFLWDRDPDANGVFDDTAGSVVRLSVDSSGSQGTCPTSCSSLAPLLTPDGRFAIFRTGLVGLDPADTTDDGIDTFVRDRDTDQDGIFDEPGAVSTQLFSRLWGSSSGGGYAVIAAEDGRRAIFLTSEALVGGDVNGLTDVYELDRDADEDGILDEPGHTSLAVVLPGDLPGFLFGGASANGRFLIYAYETPSSSPGFPGGLEVFERDADEDGVYDEPGETSTALLLDVSPFGLGGVSISEDGRTLTFSTSAPVTPRPPEALGGPHLLDRDPDRDGILDESNAIDIQFLGDVFGPFNDARVIPGTRLLDRTSGDAAGGGIVDRSLIDPLTGVEQDFSREAFFGFGDVPDLFAASRGARHVANLDFTNELVVDGIDTGDLSADQTGDGDVDDDVLAVLDARAAAPAPVLVLGPTDQAALSASGDAAFLWLEASDGIDRNGDGDALDRVVHVWPAQRPLAGSASNLGLAARGVAVSEQVVAALASEADEQTLLNGDSDLDDLVVHVNDLAAGTGGTWLNLNLAANEVQAVGPYVAFTVPEWSQGTALNGDGDQDDLVLRIYDTQAGAYVQLQDENGTPIPGFAVDDFVLGDEIVAFRVNESGQGVNLNGVAPPIPGGVADADLLDSVIHVADLATGTVYNGMQAAIPCPVEACDPRVPYRINGAKVTHLTLEAEQGGNDLDQNGDTGTGLVLQHFNAAALRAGGGMQDACDVVGGALAGICTGSAEACVTSDDCIGGGTCYFPPGGCLMDSGVSCLTSNPTACTASQFCAPILGMPGQGTCQEITGSCLTNAECSGSEVCVEDGADPEQLFASVGDEPDGRQRFVSVGRCTDGDGSCRNDADCNEGAMCDGAVTVIATAADPDLDGLADPIDNCPDVSNGDQLDLDQDGAGDACDRQTCGNGIQEYSETCDHGDQNGVDGVCDAACMYVGVGPACADGIDNDGDGVPDLADAGCADGLDTSERDPAKVCDDGRDNDGDYGSDVAGDAGCANPNSNREDPQCSDGLDNDGDGTVDWDGAGYAEPDNFCGGLPGKVRERPPKSCGVGVEIALLLPALWWLRRRRSTRALS